MDTFKTLFREIGKETAVGAIFMILLGLLMLFGGVNLLFMVIGILLLALGAVYVISYFVNYIRRVKSSSSLVYGTLLLSLGLVFYFRGGNFVHLITLIFAIALIVDGAAKFDTSLSMIRQSNNFGIFVLLFALAAIVVGILMIFDVIAGDKVIGTIILFDGIIDLLTLMILSIRVRKITRR